MDTIYTLNSLGLPGPSLGEAISFWQHPHFSKPVGSIQIIGNEINFRRLADAFEINRPTCQIIYTVDV